MTTVWTCGHSTRSFEELTALLRSAGITVLADVRASPRSRFYPHFNRKFLEANLPMTYVWLGDRLGGKNEKQVTPAMFAAGIGTVLDLASRERVCVMCSEGAPGPTKWRPEGCHRWRTIQPALEAKGADVVHL